MAGALPVALISAFDHSSRSEAEECLQLRDFESLEILGIR